MMAANDSFRFPTPHGDGMCRVNAAHYPWHTPEQFRDQAHARRRASNVKGSSIPHVFNSSSSERKRRHEEGAVRPDRTLKRLDDIRGLAGKAAERIKRTVHEHRIAAVEAEQSQFAGQLIGCERVKCSGVAVPEHLELLFDRLF